MKINIKCIISNSLDLYSYCIKIMDLKNNIIYDGYTKNDGTFLFSPMYPGLYKIIVSTNKKLYPCIICKKIFISKHSDDDTIYFVFNKYVRNYPKLVTFNLVDQAYNNLKIQKGEIILWQSNM